MKFGSATVWLVHSQEHRLILHHSVLLRMDQLSEIYRVKSNFYYFFIFVERFQVTLSRKFCEMLYEEPPPT